jgi:hypothetical protein
MCAAVKIGAAERRRLPREKILKSGVIVYDGGAKTMDCMLINFSEEGAKLRPLDALALPKSFELRVGRGPVYYCKYLRRNGCDIAVTFIAKGMDKVKR